MKKVEKRNVHSGTILPTENNDIHYLYVKLFCGFISSFNVFVLCRGEYFTIAIILPN